MKAVTYIKFLTNHIDDCESEIDHLQAENYKLNKKVEYLNEMLSCYRTRISDLEEMLEGEDYEE